MVPAAVKKITRQGDKVLDALLFNRYFHKKYFLNVISSELNGCKRILEIGSGKSSYLRDTGLQFHITALDISLNQLKESRARSVYDNYMLGDVNDIHSLLKPKSFDAILAMDLIEHLEKAKGYELIENLTAVARKKIIIYTPNGFLFQPPAQDNPFQEHRSGWSYDEMQKLGFRVTGINGHKKLSGLYAVPKIKPESIGDFARNISALLLKMSSREDLSYAILCIKTVSES